MPSCREINNTVSETQVVFYIFLVLHMRGFIRIWKLSEFGLVFIALAKDYCLCAHVRPVSPSTGEALLYPNVCQGRLGPVATAPDAQSQSSPETRHTLLSSGLIIQRAIMLKTSFYKHLFPRCISNVILGSIFFHLRNLLLLLPLCVPIHYNPARTGLWVGTDAVMFGNCLSHDLWQFI